jgi:gliding motility-associated lipoprotein GldD
MRKQTRRSVLVLFPLLVVLLTACGRNYTPKEQGYFRIDFPEKEYQLLDTIFPYTFEKAVYSAFVPVESADSDWNANIQYPALNGTLHLSYFPLNNNLNALLEDNRRIVYQHTVKADAINERYYENFQNEVYGVLYEIKGNTASSVQFYATDSVQHFLRGSLYFNNVPNKDSLAPVIQFVKEDVLHLMETLAWKKAQP